MALIILLDNLLQERHECTVFFLSSWTLTGFWYHWLCYLPGSVLRIKGGWHNAMLVFLLSLGAWMGCNRLQLNPKKNEQHWVFGPSGVEDFPLLVLDEVALPSVQFRASCAYFWTKGPCSLSLMPSWSTIWTSAISSTWGWPWRACINFNWYRMW